MIGAMQQQAAELEADNIVLLVLAEGYPNELFDLGEEHWGRAIAIKLVENGS